MRLKKVQSSLNPHHYKPPYLFLDIYFILAYLDLIYNPSNMVRTRIVCISDTHNYTPGEAGFKLPKGDVLIHAGDITNRGTEAEFRKSIEWIRKADFEVKIIIAGLYMPWKVSRFWRESISWLSRTYTYILTRHRQRQPRRHS